MFRPRDTSRSQPEVVATCQPALRTTAKHRRERFRVEVIFETSDHDESLSKSTVFRGSLRVLRLVQLNYKITGNFKVGDETVAVVFNVLGKLYAATL